MRKMAGYAGMILGATIVIAGFIAYFVRSVDGDGRAYDGFGRPLMDSPWFMRLIFGADRLWAGTAWFAADLVAFWVGMALAFALASWGFKEASNT